MTPTCYQQLYGIPAQPATQKLNFLAVDGMNLQYAQLADLHTFLEAQRPDMPANTGFSLQTVDGGMNPQGSNDAGILANLNIQYSVGIATAVPVIFISVGEENHDGALFGSLDLLNFVLDLPSSRPQVLSISYQDSEDLRI